MTFSRKSLSLPLLACLAVAVAGCKDEKQAAAPAQQSGPAVEVTVITTAPERVPLITELPGRTAAFRVAEVRPQVGGIVLKRLFEEGSEVKAGQQLYQIDPATYQAAVQSAQADLAKARATLKSIESKAARYADLVQINAVSKQDYDDVVASLDQAKAQIMVAQSAVDTARINVNYTRVYAPISGRIGKSGVTEGALVTANQSTSLATITQLDPIYVDVSQSVTDLMKLRQSLANGSLQAGSGDRAPVTLTLDGAAQPYPHKGEMQFSDVTVDQSTGTVQVRAVFPNPDKTLYPGLFVRARIEQGQRDNALLIPQRALVRTQDGSSAVWVVGDDNKVAPRPVAVSQVVGDRWVVESGLQPGQRVVVEGLQKIRPGAEVRTIDAAPSAQAQAAPQR